MHWTKVTAAINLTPTALGASKTQTFSEIPATATEICMVTGDGAAVLPLILNVTLRSGLHFYFNDNYKGTSSVDATLKQTGVTVGFTQTSIGAQETVQGKGGVSAIYWR